MKRFGFLLILLTIFSACQKDSNRIKVPYKLIPSDVEVVIQINEIADFTNTVDNDQILSKLYSNQITEASKLLNHLNTTNQVFLSLLDSSKENSDYIILTQNDSSLFVLDSIPNHNSEKLTNNKITKTQIDSLVFYHTKIGRVFAGSNNLATLEALDSKNENKELTRLIETTNTKSVASIIFKSNSPNYSKLLFLSESGIDYTVLDIAQSDNSLQYNGIITTKDSIGNTLNSFKGLIPQKLNTIRFAPYNTNSLTSITFDDFSTFNKNINAINPNATDSTKTFLNFTNEIALIDNALLLHTLDPSMILESIEEKSNAETFREIEIYNFETPGFFELRLNPFMSVSKANFFAVYDDFIVFAESTDIIKSILTNALNEKTLANTRAFESINGQLSNEASLFIFKNSEGLSEIFGNSAKGFNANAVQFIFEDDYAHINGIIQKFKKRAASNSVSEAFTTQLDAQILTAPQAVKNHVTNAHDIAVQDVNNILYLISDAGNILWKKQLNGKILGRIEQMDIFKNGRLQLSFATQNRVYLLDRNGKDVSGFPLKFKDKITQPLSVFDYDKKKDYRLLVAQGENLIMYDAKGKSVKGFGYKTNNSEITSQPKHFRIGSKDYIVFSAGKNLTILNRQGSVRVHVKDKIDFSKNAIYLYQNKFTTTNTLGQLIQVDTKGKQSIKNLNLPEKHNIETTSKTLVSMTENKLNIKSRTVDLDYGNYTNPKIYYLNDKIYVTITDLQSKKVYLYDSQAKPIPNFPIYGVSSAELQELDKDKGLELITQSDENTIVVYKLN